jgi:hypothetical protein
MAIGLESNGLLQILIASLENRWEKFENSLELADMGFDPETKGVIEKMNEHFRKTFPNITDPRVLTMASVYLRTVGLALMDCIVANNRELAKAIPHIET